MEISGNKRRKYFFFPNICEHGLLSDVKSCLTNDPETPLSKMVGIGLLAYRRSVYTLLQSRDTTPPFWNWSQWQENSQAAGYLSTDTSGIHPRQEQQQRFRTTYWQTERASFFFPSQLTTDFSDLGVSYSSFSLERSALFRNCHSSAYKRRRGKVQKSLTGEK